MVWDNNTTASWMTTGSYLTYANSATTASATWVDTPALSETAFIAGDVIVFDSTTDLVTFTDPDTGEITTSDPAAVRNIAIADAGVTASEIVISGQGSYVFTGGAMTTNASSIVDGSVQITGTGVGLAANAIMPTGRLIKIGTGELVLSNTVANHFEGGIYLGQGTLTIEDARALGNNNISVLTVATSTNKALCDVHGQVSGSNFALPGTVLDSAGNLLRDGSNALSGAGLVHVSNTCFSVATIRVPTTAAGLDITGDVYLSNHVLTFEIYGDTTISGRMYGTIGSYGATGGTFYKTGGGTLTITGTHNWFYGRYKTYNQIQEGRVVVTNPYALGTGSMEILPGASLEFRGVKGSMTQAFIGGGNIEITQGSDLTFDWRNGTLYDFDGMSGNASWHPAMNEIGTITISGQSRFSAIASGTYSSVLGGGNAYIAVTEGSTLVIGREGLSARGSGATGIPMTYAILANRIDLGENATLVLKPNAYLSTGALIATDTTAAIAFTASGVSRLRWQEGIDPSTITLTATGSTNARYIVPDGMELIINDIPVPVHPSESIPTDPSAAGWCREFVLVNQGANPLKDIAITLAAIDAIHDTVSARLADELIDPVTLHVPVKGRKWVNSAWARYVTSDLDYDTESAITPGIDGNAKTIVAGFDGILPGRVLIGLHGGIGENELDSTNNTSLSSKQRFLGVHAAQRFGQYYLAFSADIGRASTDSFRYEADNYVRGKWDTSYYSGSIQLGGTFESWAKIKIKPYVGLRYSKVKITNYYERGASPLVVDNFNDTLAQAAYGVALGRKFVVFKRDLALDLSLARKHNITTPRSTLATYYFDSPDTPIALKRGNYYGDPTAIGLSARVAVSQHTIVGLAFDYEKASHHDRTTFSVLVSYTW